MANFFSKLERGNVTMVGMGELGRTLDLLANESAKRAVRTAIKPAIEVFRREIRKNAPRRVESWVTGFGKAGKGKKNRQPGYLKSHIGRWLVANAADGSLSAFAGPTPSAFYGRFVERGTVHAPARPFMRPAFDSKKNEALKVFGDELWKQLQTEIRK